MTFKPLMTPVRPGEPLAAGVVGRPDRQAFDNILYLKSLFDSLIGGQGLIQRDQPISSSVEDLMVVYYNNTTERFEPAIASSQVGPNGLIESAPACYPMGLVIQRGQTDIADILCFGRLDRDVTSMGLTGGLYFLSSTTPGRLTKVKPALGIPVLFTDGSTFVFVNPQWRDVMDDHRHYAVELVCRPAGSHTPPSVGQPHTIPTPNVLLAGWLPANHASFGGRAPAGAKFGYNLAADLALSSVWPPIPSSAFELVWNRGVDVNDGGRTVPRTLYQVDSNGLWWMSDCYGDVPWPTAYNSATPDALDCPDPPLSCPRGLCMTMTAHLIRLQVGVGQGLVTSLRPKTNSGLSINCLGSATPAVTGDLEISFEGFTSGDDDDDGILAFKTFANNTFQSGPVVSSIRAGTDNVSISGSDVDGEGRPYGHIAISVDATGATRFIEPDVAKLDGTTDEYPNGVPTFGFLPGQASGLLLRFAVPFTGLPTNPQMVLRFLLGGSVAGTTPTLRLFYKRLARPTGGSTVSLSAAETELTTGWVPGKVLGAGNVYYEVDSPPFTVVAGDIVICRLTRAVDGYAGTVFVVNEVGFVQGS